MNYIRNEDGIALIMVLLMLVVVGVLSGSLLVAYNNNIQQSGDQAEQTKEFYAAESAVNIIDQIIEKFNYEEGNLGMHTDYHYKQRLNDLEEEINNFIDDNNISMDNYGYRFNITDKNMDEYYLLIEVDALNKDTNSIEETIEIKYNVKTSGYGGFFAHTLAANEIEINGDAFDMVENLLFNDWQQINDTVRVRTFKSDLLGDIPRLATGEGMNSDLGNHEFIVREEREVIEESGYWEEYWSWEWPWGWRERWVDTSEYGDWETVETANLNEVIEFYGEESNDKNLYLPETENAEDFTDYVETVNFVEVLKQNNVSLVFNEDESSVPVEDMSVDYLFNKLKEEREESASSEFDFNSFLDKYDQNYDSNSNNLSDYLNGYFDNMEQLRDQSANIGSDNSPGPYIYVRDFEFDDSDSNRNNYVNFTNFNTVNDVVHLFIKENIDFSDKNDDILFTSYNQKSVLVQSGGNEINLDGKRILYRTGGSHLMQGIAYYAPNATMYMNGDMPGTGWGQSYNVNKIIMDDDVTFPPFSYDPENSGFMGNIHSDIADYLGGEDQVGDYSAGEVSRSKWRLIR
jgi:Tfp pilus assembly protein PilE